MSMEFADWISDFIAKKLIFLTPSDDENIPDTKHPVLPAMIAASRDKAQQAALDATHPAARPSRGGSGPLGRVARIRLGRG